ncbi:hypothetical protein D3C78_1062390 [compost metagenome]
MRQIGQSRAPRHTGIRVQLRGAGRFIPQVITKTLVIQAQHHFVIQRPGSKVGLQLVVDGECIQ